MAARIKKGDLVVVIAGGDKNKTGKILEIRNKQDRVVVEGINRVWKHVKPNQQNPQGGRIQKEAPIHMSNVMPVDPDDGQGHAGQDDGQGRQEEPHRQEWRDAGRHR